MLRAWSICEQPSHLNALSQFILQLANVSNMSLMVVIMCEQLLAVFLDVRGLDADQVDLSSVEIQVAEITQQLRALIRVYDHPTA